MIKRGVIYVAYGDNARDEAAMSLRTLRQPGDRSLPVAVVSDAPLVGAQHIPFDEPGWGARWAKLNLDRLTPFEQTIYLDADTRPRADVSVLFDALADGFELVIAPSTMQDDKALWHIERDEREATLDEFGFTPLQIQAGVFAFRRCAAVTDLFAAWREEWKASPQPTQDQAALLRALHRSPVRLWLISATMSDVLVSHLFGRLH